MPSPSIQTPSGYTVSHAVAFADAEGGAVTVSAAAPLPVAISAAAPLPVSANRPLAGALAGTAASSGQAGPFVPVVDRAIMLTLSGTWTGTVRLLRSTDGGATRLPLTIAGTPWAQFTANCCEPIWEETDPAATLYLDATLATGTLAYRIAQ